VDKMNYCTSPKTSAIAIIATIALTLTTAAAAQNAPIAGTRGATPEASAKPAITNAYFPESSIAKPGDAGQVAHTHYVLRSANGARPAAAAVPLLTEAETPASMGCVYKIGPTYAGCNPASGGTLHPTGGFGAIALVDAFDNPFAASDLANFSSFWGLPAASFAQIYCTTAAVNGGCLTTNAPPAGDTGWGLEEALDIEWAHVMAPAATIYLVEAATSSCTDLAYAVAWAGAYVQAAGGGTVSNSWGCGEWSTESNFDPNFYNAWNKTTYLASSGDGGAGASWPASIPWVVAAGGTTVNRTSLGNFSSESCWAGSGGGYSAFENSQGYQFVLQAGGKRAIPDLSFNANPASGVWVLDFDNGGWFVVGGTSVASPALAGIIDNIGNKVGQGTSYPFQGFGFLQNQEDYLIYGQMPTAVDYKKNFYDPKTGSNGFSAAALYDLCTGVGTPRGKAGK
jgi:kumamolisin